MPAISSASVWANERLSYGLRARYYDSTMVRKQHTTCTVRDAKQAVCRTVLSCSLPASGSGFIINFEWIVSDDSQEMDARAAAHVVTEEVS